MGRGRKIVQGSDANHGRRQRGGNLRVAQVGDVLDTMDFEIVQLGVEGRADLSSGAGEVDDHTA